MIFLFLKTFSLIRVFAVWLRVFFLVGLQKFSLWLSRKYCYLATLLQRYNKFLKPPNFYQIFFELIS